MVKITHRLLLALPQRPARPLADVEAQLNDGDRFTPVLSQHVLGTTFPCQRQAAYLLNSMRDAKARGRVDEVAFRGQQAVRAFGTSVQEAVALSCSVGLGYEGAKNYLYLPAVLLVAIDIGNARRHAQTYHEAKDVLTRAVGSEERAIQILDMKAKKNNFEAFASALDAAGVDTQALRRTKGWYASPKKGAGRCCISLAQTDVSAD